MPKTDDANHETVRIDATVLTNDYSELTRPELRRLARAYLDAIPVPTLRAAVAKVREDGHFGCIRLASGWDCGGDCCNAQVNAAVDAILTELGVTDA